MSADLVADSQDRSHRLAPAILTVGGTIAAIASWRLGVGEASQPGPGAWPLVASVAVVLTSAWLTSTGIDAPEAAERSDLSRVAIAVAATAAFVALLPLVGMPMPAFLVITVWMRLFGESWKLSLLTASLGVVSLQLLFVQLLGVPLPVGPLAPGA